MIQLLSESVEVQFFVCTPLKKIPSDLVSYIQIETEAIKDANDKKSEAKRS